MEDSQHVRQTREMRCDIRQAEAQGRQASYDSLTTQQKIDNLPADGAVKQRARLESQLAAETTAKSKPAKSKPKSKSR